MNTLLSIVYSMNKYHDNFPTRVKKMLTDFKLICSLSEHFTQHNRTYRDDLSKIYEDILSTLLRTNFIDLEHFNSLVKNKEAIIDLLILNSNSNHKQNMPISNKNRTESQDNLFLDNFKELITINAHFSHIFTVKFDKQGKFLYSGSDDTVIKQWDVSTMLLTKTYTKHEREIGDLDISDCGKLMVSCGLDKQVIIWDTYSGALLHKYKSHHSEITRIFFIESIKNEEKDFEEKYILSVSDKEVYIHTFKYRKVKNQYGIIKASSAKQLKQLASPFTAVEITDNKQYCVVAFKDHTLRIYELKKGEMKIASTVSIKEQIDKISIVEHKEEHVVLLMSDKGNLFLHFLYKLIIADPHELHYENLTKLYLNSKIDGKKRTVQVHRMVYMAGYTFIAGNMDTILIIKMGPRIQFFVAPKVHKEDNIFWMNALPHHNILISGGADGYMVVWRLNEASQTKLDPILVYESQKYEEEDRTAEDILDITSFNDMVAIGTRFGGVTLFGLQNLINNDYSQTPIEQEFLEDIRNIDVPVNLFKTLVNRSGELVSFAKEEQKESGFFRFEVHQKNNTTYKVLKENLYHPELANNNTTGQRTARTASRVPTIIPQEVPLENQEVVEISPTNTTVLEETTEHIINDNHEEDVEIEDNNDESDNSSNEPLSDEDGSEEQIEEIEEQNIVDSQSPEPLQPSSNPNLLNTSNEDDFLDSVSNSEDESTFSKMKKIKRTKIVRSISPVDFVAKQTFFQENAQLENVYIPQMGDIVVYSPEAHICFLYLNQEVLSDYTVPTYPFVPAHLTIDGDRKCKVTNITYRFHNEGLSNSKFGFKLVRITLDVIEEQTHRFIKNNKFQKMYSRDRGIQFELDVFLPHEEMYCTSYTVPFDIYEEHFRDKTVKLGKLKYKKECFDDSKIQIHYIHNIKDNRRSNLNLLTDHVSFKLCEVTGKKNHNSNVQIKSSRNFNNFIFTNKIEHQNTIVAELNALKDNDFLKLLDVYKRNMGIMYILSLWNFNFEKVSKNFVYRSGISEMEQSLLLSVINKFLEKDEYYLYREINSRHYQDNYFQTVANPIGLVDIKERIENDYYRTTTQLLLEVNTIYQNCLKCSLSYSKFSRDCKKLVQEVTQKIKHALGCLTSSSQTK